MPTIDISRLFRILPSFLQENPELQAQALTLIRIADGNEAPDAEDAELSGEEIRRHVEKARQELQGLNRDWGILNAQRLQLLGPVEQARQTLEALGVGSGVRSQIETAATWEEPARSLSLAEIERLSRELQQVLAENSTLNPLSLELEAQRFVQELSEMEREHPERFFPSGSESQRATLNLEALRWIEPPEWEAILNLPPPRENETEAEVGIQERFYRLISTLISVADIDPQQPPGSWSLEFAAVERRFSQLPESVRQAYGDAEHLMAELRYVAHEVSEEINRHLADRILANPDSTVAGISLQPLLDDAETLADPRAQLFLEEAGPDGVLTRLELGRSLRRHYAATDSPPAQEDVLDELKLLITARSPREAGAEPPNFRREVSLLVLSDLQRMLDGFTNSDRRIAVEGGGSFGWATPLLDAATWVVSLGGRTTGGQLYSDVLREAVEVNDSRRSHSLARLRDLIERPSFEFQDWLRARGADPHSGAIPEALEFLRATAPEHAAMLAGPFFQARRIWDIRNMPDAEEQARHWLAFALELRGRNDRPFTLGNHLYGYHSFGLGSGTVSSIVNNEDYARAILHSLRAESRSPGLRLAADHKYRRSLGYDILDSEGRLVERGGGELGINPALWFRNFSDEAAATAIGDGVLLASSFYGGGFPMRGLRALGSQAGRRALLQGLGRFVGLRAAQTIEFAEMPLLGQAGRAPSWLSRRVAAAETRLGAARTEVARFRERLNAGGSTDLAELRRGLATAEAGEFRAQAALDRARNVHRILTMPLRAGEAVAELGKAAYRGSRWVRWPLQAGGWVLGNGFTRYLFASYLYQQIRRPRPEPDLSRFIEYRIGLP
ncbi:MAG TPA: hypothetical protein VJR29_05500 [bacterium]|nr:hypothetical protein [bacterium]